MFKTQPPVTSALLYMHTLKLTVRVMLGALKSQQQLTMSGPLVTACVAVKIEVTFSAHLCKYTALKVGY